MKYNFDENINRLHTNSMKWDVDENVLPMWVADMDFMTAPAIREAIQTRASHGVFGYTILPNEWYCAYQTWWKNRHHFEIEKEWLMFCTGVVPAISSIVRKLTTPAENVLIQTPVYNIFFNSILNNGRKVLESPLHFDGEKYEIDFVDLEEKMADPQTTLMILCNPHNPVGKIWSREELARIGSLAKKHHVLILSDEIHCDLTDPGCEYIPFASVNEECASNSVTCIAPTKTFNIAGLQTAAIVVPDSNLRHKVSRGINTDEVAEPNVFAVEAPIAAFTKSSDWLDELRVYLYDNKKTVRDFIHEHLPMLKVIDSEATYLLWIDCTKVMEDATELACFLKEHAGLLLSEGEEYGKPGKAFLRMNTATSRNRILEGLSRLEKGIHEFIKMNK